MFIAQNMHRSMVHMHRAYLVWRLLLLLFLGRFLVRLLAVGVMVGWLKITLRLFSSLRPAFRVFAFAAFFSSSSTLQLSMAIVCLSFPTSLFSMIHLA